MSVEAGLLPGLKWLLGTLAGLLFGVLGWVASRHSDKLDEVGKEVDAMRVDLAKNYHSKEEVERQVALMMAPTNERLDSLITTMTQAVDELRKLNERVIKVETKQR
jgi:hypothetical protein